MKILITGAAGCIGRKLVAKLAGDPSVVVYASDIKPNPFAATENVVYQRFDLRESSFIDWVNTIAPEKVVHLASILQLSAAMGREQAHAIDVQATAKLLQSSIALGVKKFIVTTSGAAYGYYPENREVIDETRPTRGNQDYFYSAHKAEVEAMMADYRAKHPELAQIVFRPGAILGADFDGPIVDFFAQKVITGILGYPGPFNFIWADDVVDYLIEGLHSDISGQFNIAGDGVMTMKQIAQRLNKPYLALPGWLIQGALAIAKPLGLTRFGPEQVKFIKYRPVLANDKIKAVFKHQPQYTTTQTLDAYLRTEDR